VLTGRSLTMQPGAWAPHYLITAVPPGPDERDRLIALARKAHRTATGYLVAGLTDGATWTWEVTGSGRLRAPLLGFDVAAQLLPARQYAAVAGLFAATQAAATGLDHPDLDAVPAAQLMPGAVLPVEVTLSAGRGLRARRDRALPLRAGHRDRGLPGRAPRRGAPHRADRRDLAARGDRRGAGRGAGPRHSLAQLRPGRAAPDHRRRRSARAGPAGPGGLAGVPRAGGPGRTGASRAPP
jgi:hypothetical protein